MCYSEIEIQVRIENVEKLLCFLEHHASNKMQRCEIDQYYTPAHKDFTKQRPVTEWLRLRNADNAFFMNYKKIYYDNNGHSHFRDEFETKISDLDAAKKIVEALGFRPLVKVDKLRKIYNYNDYEIAIDSVKGLGEFVEIEYKGNETPQSEAENITAGMIQFLQEIGCGKIKRNYLGYPFQLLFPAEVTIEDY